MKIGEIKNRLIRHFSGPSKLVFCLRGPAGIGKSDVVKQAASAAGLEYIDLRLGQLEPSDFTGIPRVVDGKTVYMPPSWWPEKPVVLFLDELNRAPLDTRQGVFQLLTEYKLYTHNLPEGSKIVVAINPDNGVYQVEQLGVAMEDRMLIYDVEPSIDDFLVWGKQNGIYNKVLEFLAVQPSMLINPNRKPGSKSPSPRAWHYVSKLFTDNLISENDPNFIQDIIAAVGDIAAAAFMRYVKDNYQKFLTYEDLIKKYDKNALLKQANSEMLGTISDVSAAIESLKGKEWENSLKLAIKLVKDLPNEFKVAFVLKLSDKSCNKMIELDMDSDDANNVAAIFANVVNRANSHE